MTVSVSTSLGEMSDAGMEDSWRGSRKSRVQTGWIQIWTFVFLWEQEVGDLPLLSTDFQNIEKRIYLF